MSRIADCPICGAKASIAGRGTTAWGEPFCVHCGLGAKPEHWADLAEMAAKARAWDAHWEMHVGGEDTADLNHMHTVLAEERKKGGLT